MSDSAQAPAASQRDHFALIDGLRGFAAMAVVLFHQRHFALAGVEAQAVADYHLVEPGRGWLWPVYDYGYLAVQLFWMISGFVFAGAYLGRAASTRGFVVNRLARLYPLHLLTLLIVTLLQAVALARLGTTLIYGHYDPADFAAQLLFAANWVDSTRHTFNGPIWSVSVEVLVYLLFWLLRAPLNRMRPAGFLLLLLGCLLAVPFAGPSQVPACAFFFFAGVWVFRLVPLALAAPRVTGGIALGAFAIVTLAGEQGLLRNLAAVAGMGASLALLAALERRAGPRLRAAGQWLGDCSYGIYLWHVPLQLVLLLIFLPGPDLAQLASHIWFVPLWLGSLVLVARLSFVSFERPARMLLRQRLGGGEGRKKGDDTLPRFA